MCFLFAMFVVPMVHYIPLARTKRRNGAANVKRAQRDILTANVSQAHGDDVTPMEAADATPPTTTSSAPHTTTRGRRANSERAGKRPRRRLTREVRG